MRVKHKQRRLLVLGLTVLLLLPAQCHYVPPLVGAAGYETHLVTDPGYLGSVLKWLQTHLELTPCTYRVLGWDTQSHLYYQAECWGTTLWRYDPQRHSAYPIRTVPRDVAGAPVEDEAIEAIVRAEEVRPRVYESITRRLYLVADSGVASPDGHAIAFITQRVYSVYDIVVLRDMEPSSN